MLLPNQKIWFGILIVGRLPMRQRARKLATAVAILITLWLIWDKLHIVVWVQMPWWGLLIMAVVIFLAIDYIFAQIFD